MAWLEPIGGTAFRIAPPSVSASEVIAAASTSEIAQVQSAQLATAEISMIGASVGGPRLSPNEEFRLFQRIRRMLPAYRDALLRNRIRVPVADRGIVVAELSRINATEQALNRAYGLLTVAGRQPFSGWFAPALEQLDAAEAAGGLPDDPILAAITGSGDTQAQQIIQQLTEDWQTLRGSIRARHGITGSGATPDMHFITPFSPGATRSDGGGGAAPGPGDPGQGAVVTADGSVIGSGGGYAYEDPSLVARPVEQPVARIMSYVRQYWWVGALVVGGALLTFLLRR